jgi:Phytoene dehydrogenase and related proteins
MKKVLIVGAGISGLVCGTYLAKNGFDVEIYESHSIAGGECTGWERGGFYFDNCIDWLVGSKEGSPMNRLWRDVGALDGSVKIFFQNEFYEYREGERSVYFYADPEKLYKHLIEIAPEDKKRSRRSARA